LLLEAKLWPKKGKRTQVLLHESCVFPCKLIQPSGFEGKV